MSKLPGVNFLDRAIEWVSPKWAFERKQYRIAADIQKRAYDGAGRGRRTDKWRAQATSATTEVHGALELLRNRNRELVRNNPYALKAVTELANNIAGTGIMATPKMMPAVGMTKKQAKMVNDTLKTVFKTWADSTDADYEGHMNYWGLCHLAVRCCMESGEVLIRKHVSTDKGLVMPLQLRVLEGDYIDSTKWVQGLAGGGYIYYGVEFNAAHKIVAYWLWETHPGDNYQFNMTSNRVPAEEIIHFFIKERPGQFRGVPAGHGSMLRLKDFDEYEDAQLVRQKIAACFSVFVQDSSINATAGMPGGGAADVAQLEKVEPGIIEYLPAGKTMSFATPPDAGAGYEPYTKGVLRGIAAGYGMDYVTMTGDLTGVNFSSGRMGWLQFHRNIGVLQQNSFIPIVCNKVWRWYMQMAVVMGYSRTVLVPVAWTPPRREMIDPVKETNAQMNAIEGGLTSWSETARENGWNAEDLLEEMKLDKENFDAAGVMPVSDPRFQLLKISQPKASEPSVDGSKGV